jgi:hypothetical protein
VFDFFLGKKKRILSLKYIIQILNLSREDKKRGRSYSSLLFVILVQSNEPLHKGGMRVVPSGIQGIRVHVSEILDINLDEPRLEKLFVAQVFGKVVCLVLEFPGEGHGKEGRDLIHRGKDVL